MWIASAGSQPISARLLPESTYDLVSNISTVLHLPPHAMIQHSANENKSMMDYYRFLHEASMGRLYRTSIDRVW